jgi:hypothetical protein
MDCPGIRELASIAPLQAVLAKAKSQSCRGKLVLLASVTYQEIHSGLQVCCQLRTCTYRREYGEQAHQHHSMCPLGDLARGPSQASAPYRYICHNHLGSRSTMNKHECKQTLRRGGAMAPCRKSTLSPRSCPHSSIIHAACRHTWASFPG